MSIDLFLHEIIRFNINGIMNKMNERNFFLFLNLTLIKFFAYKITNLSYIGTYQSVEYSCVDNLLFYLTSTSNKTYLHIYKNPDILFTSTFLSAKFISNKIS